jgi:RNA polymerase sigma-70 factor (ECF subfamily)
MSLDSVLEGSQPARAGSGAAGSQAVPKFDPVRLELGEAGEDGELLVYRKYQFRIRRFFESKRITPEEARDLTQETFLRVFRGEGEFENRAQLEAWLFEIAANVRHNVLRGRAALKRAGIEVSLDEPGLGGVDREEEIADPALVDGEQDALTAVITREQVEGLRAALAELPLQMRQCLRLRLHQDLKYKEIAEIMRISIDTVKSHLYQAKQRLREQLEPLFGPIDF